MSIYIIAEIAQAHDGSLGIAHSYIDALAETGVNAVKFQTHIAEAESSEYEPFRVKFSYEDNTRYDYWKRMEFTFEQWMGLKSHCDDIGLEFISSPFSNAAVDLLEKLNVKKYKVGSGEVSNLLLMEKIGLTGKDVILSSGLSSFDELDKTVEFLKERVNNLSVLHCTTAYPTKPGEWKLHYIPILKERYNIPVGYSDHSGDIFSSLAAVTLGADIIEFHAVFDKRMFGPDAKASLTINEIKKLIYGIRQIETDFNQFKVDAEKEILPELKSMFGKSLCVNKDMKIGQMICFDDLESKKPFGKGISSVEYQNIIGCKLKKNLKKWNFIQKEDIEFNI